VIGETRITALLCTDDQTGELVARRWRIEVEDGPDAGATLVRDVGTVTVGSHRDADLRLSDTAVSRYHLELRLLAEGVLAVDLDSRNGTRVGGERVDRALVMPGGAISLGRTRLVVQPEDDAIELDASELDRFGEAHSRSPALRRLFAQLRKVAAADTTVLIQGESGTGKELIARAIHAGSPRRDGPFVVLDCGAVAKSLFESQLFGHKKGAFTGASGDHAGAVETAGGGTLFLDELGDLPLEIQPKLLRVLEARSVCRLGEERERPVDVRFVAATHRDLVAASRDGRFREDLYYRVAVVRAQIPPLRERPEDIALLAVLLLERISDGRLTLSSEVLAALEAYHWPGNVRELRNVIERAVALAPSERIDVADLFPADDRPPVGRFLEEKEQLIARFEQRYVEDLLSRHQGNVSAAAREAGLSRNALYSLIKRVGL